jgi:hypothetical protein
MKHARLLAALAVLCLIAVPALSAQAENGPTKNADGSNGCKMASNGNGACPGPGCPQNWCENGCQNAGLHRTGSQNGSGNQNGHGQNGNGGGPQDGSGPRRDGRCQS